jgi:hypothetical protein
LWDAIVSGGDTSKLLEPADGALDAVPELVLDRVERAFAGHAGALRDDRLGVCRLDVVEDGMAVIGLVGEDVGGIEAGQQRDGRPGVTGIAAGQDEADGTAERIDRDVPLGGQSASGAPQSLVAGPPFWPVAAWAWARTIELSIIR